MRFPNRDLLRHWPLLAEAALWLVLALQLTRLGWLLFAPASVSGAPALTVLPARIPDLSGHDPFLAATATATATTLDGWQLFGLRTLADGQGSAILGRANQPQTAYRVGDEIAPGLLLAAVATDHVELGNGQRLELAGSTPIAVAAPIRTAPPTPTQTANFDPAQLLEAGLQARTVDGRIHGYTLLPRGNSELLLRAVGLQPGDVLLNINGQVLSPTVIGELAGELKSNPKAVVTFERDGRTRTLNLGTGTP